MKKYLIYAVVLAAGIAIGIYGQKQGWFTAIGQ